MKTPNSMPASLMSFTWVVLGKWLLDVMSRNSNDNQDLPMFCFLSPLEYFSESSDLDLLQWGRSLQKMTSCLRESTTTISQRFKNHFLLLFLLAFFIFPSQTEMISCHEPNVPTSLLLGQQIHIPLLYPTVIIST